MAKAIKASDKQAVWRKVATALKKRYKDTLPKTSEPVLETLLYAACLENTTYEVATKTYDSLIASFFDLNEIRVSSITELSKAMGDTNQPEHRALWVRSTLQYVFESNYEYQFEKIRRKTFELASRHLGRITNATSFMQLHTLQQTMSAFVTPMDDKMTAAAIWLGFVTPGSSNEEAAEQMKSAVKKADAAMMCHQLRLLANDPKLQVAFEEAAEADVESAEAYDLMAAPKRLDALFKSPPRRKPKPKPVPKKKAVAKQGPAKKAKKPTKAAATKTKKKAAAKKVVKKKPAKKKAPVKKKAAASKATKKKTTKKKVVKKAAARKTATKKKAAKKKKR